MSSRCREPAAPRESGLNAANTRSEPSPHARPRKGAPADSGGRLRAGASGVLHQRGAQYAEEGEGTADLGEIHVTGDDRARSETLREQWERKGLPEDARDDEALDEDRSPEPGPDDWR